MESMNQIYQKYAKTVYGYIFAKTNDHQIAEELTQETFYQGIKSINRYDGSCKISTWLCAIAKNQLKTYYRKNPKMAELTDDEHGGKTAENQALDNLMTGDILKVIHNQKEPYREVLYLRILGALTFKDIGNILGKSENWARVTFYRGKEKLKGELEEYEK